MNIQDIKKQLSLIETTLKDINGKLMLELLDVMTENRELKEQIAKVNENTYYDEYPEENNFSTETVRINKIEASVSTMAEETMVFGIHPVTGKRISELALYAKRHGEKEWNIPEGFIQRDFPSATLKDNRYHTDGRGNIQSRILSYDLSEPMEITYGF